MLPDRVSNSGPLTYESGALPIALPGPATVWKMFLNNEKNCTICGVLPVRAMSQNTKQENLTKAYAIDTNWKSYTVDSRYLDFGYLEQPLISKKKSGPCLNIEI